MNKKRIIKKVIVTISWIAVCSLLLLYILYNVPWRTRIDLEMPCTQIAKDGTVLSTGETVTIKGWELKYLLRPKEEEIMLESFMLPVFSAPVKTDSDCPLTLSKKIYPYAAFGAFWDSKMNFCGIYISLEEDWKTCLIRLDGGQYFACSLDGSVPASDIAEIHKWILD